jgi:hypothetical protein
MKDAMKKSAVSKRLRNVLTKRGLKPELIERVVRETLGGQEAEALKKLPRLVSERLRRVLSGPGAVAVVVRGKGKGLRVFSEAGYKSVVAQGHRVGGHNKKVAVPAHPEHERGHAG